MRLPEKLRIGCLTSRRLRGAVVIAVSTVLTWAGSTATYADEMETETEVIATTPGTSYSRSSVTGWTGATGREDTVDKTPRPTSSLTIRAYEGFGTLRPYIGDQQAYGVDVTAQIETCANGSDRISALNIGGRHYAVDGDCSDNQRRSRVSVSTAKQTNSANESDKEVPGEPVLRCDPATWRCRTIDRQSGDR